MGGGRPVTCARLGHIAAALGMLLAVARCGAQASGSVGEVVVLAAPGLRASDLTSPHVPALQSLVRRSAVGWMNCRVARTGSRRDEGEAAAWLTLGAGARAAAPPDAGAIAARDLPRTVDTLGRLNSRLDHRVAVGALGDLARRAGLRTVAVGDEDALKPDRSAWLMIADSRGRIDHAEHIAGRAEAHARFEPYGRATPAALLTPGGEGALSLLVFGDLSRANRYEPLCMPGAAAAMRNRALDRLDATVGMLAQRLARRPGSALLLLSAAAAEGGGSADRLAPVLLFGGGVRPGLLTSGSTRTPGLIANTDMLPTIAALIGVAPPPGLVGRPIRSVGAGEPTARLWRELHDRWYARALLQAQVGGLPTVQTLMLAAAVLGWWRRQSRWERLARCCAGVVLCLPLVGIVAPAVGVHTLTGAIAVLTLVSVLVGGACVASTTGAYATLAGLVATTLAACGAGLLPHSRWFASAWPSYSLMEGARYYGIGNEYAAVLGACLVVALAWGSRANRRVHVAVSLAVGALGLLVAALVGHPALGANVGGAGGIALGSVALGVALRRDRMRARDVLLALGAVAAVIGLAVLADLLCSTGEQSHMARALAASDGPAGIALRKAALNLWLLPHSPWTPLLLCGLGGLAVLGWHGKRERDPRGWWAARTAIVWLAAGLLALNDSGVVAAAECLAIGVSALGLWAAVPRLDIQGPVSVN